MLTQRGKDIIILLVQQPEDYPLTLAVISQQLGVSRRTIMREISSVKDWMDKQGYNFESRSGSGLILKENQDNRNEILEKLSRSKGENLIRGKDLQGRFISELLQSDEPLKIAYFSRQYDMSESSFQKEIDEATIWFDKYNVKLCKKAGVGIFLEYNEEAFRLALCAWVYEFFDNKTLLLLIQNKNNNNFKLPYFFIQNEIETIVDILAEAQKQLNVSFTDGSYINMFVNLSLIIYRVRLGYTVVLAEEKMARVNMLGEYAVAEYISDYLCKELNLELKLPERAFIAINLAGSHIWGRENVDNTETEHLEVLRIALEMCEIMENELEVSLAKNSVLLRGLCTHIETVAKRFATGAITQQPDVEKFNIDEKLFNATKKACDILKRECKIQEISLEEIAYIAIHFGVALEEANANSKKIHAAVVCLEGMSTSKLLAIELQKSFKEIAVCDIYSARMLNVDKLKKAGVDIIFTTVGIDIDYPHIKISHNLNMREKQLVSASVEKLTTTNIKNNESLQKTNELTLDSILFMSRFGNQIISVLDNIKYNEVGIIRNRNELIIEASKLFAIDEISQNDIELALIRRDTLSDTYVKPFNSLLLHAKTAFINNPSIGYVAQQLPFYEKGHVIMGAIVMLLPENANDADTTLMSEISASLLRQKGLLDSLKTGKINEFKKQLEQALKESYCNIAKDKIELDNRL